MKSVHDSDVSRNSTPVSGLIISMCVALTLGMIVFAIILLSNARDPQWRPIGTAEAGWPAAASVRDLLSDSSTSFYGGLPLGPGGHTYEARGTFVLIGDPRRVIVIWTTDAPENAPGGVGPVIRLELSALIMNKNGLVLPDGGVPPVYSDLNQQQADHVMEHGVPRSLIDAILIAGQNAGWTPLPVDGDRQIDPNAIVFIAPGPHFPK